MGLLTAELPDGRIHQWIGHDRGIITAFLERFREKVLVSMAD